MPGRGSGRGTPRGVPAGAGRVLVAQADRARRSLADGLPRVGHRVESVTAYRTVSPAGRRPRSSSRSTRPTPWCSPVARPWPAGSTRVGPRAAPSSSPSARSPPRPPGRAASTCRHVAAAASGRAVADLVAAAFPPSRQTGAGAGGVPMGRWQALVPRRPAAPPAAHPGAPRPGGRDRRPHERPGRPAVRARGHHRAAADRVAARASSSTPARACARRSPSSPTSACAP